MFHPPIPHSALVVISSSASQSLWEGMGWGRCPTRVTDHSHHHHISSTVGRTGPVLSSAQTLFKCHFIREVFSDYCMWNNTLPPYVSLSSSVSLCYCSFYLTSYYRMYFWLSMSWKRNASSLRAGVAFNNQCNQCLKQCWLACAQLLSHVWLLPTPWTVGR